MIIDFTKTEELCQKIREITGKAVSIDYEIFLHKSGNEKRELRLWIEDAESIKMDSTEKLNTWLEYTIEYQQKMKGLTND